MLVLTRNAHESIVINDNIFVTVLPASEGAYYQMRLGFTAPSDIPIHRKEIWDIIQQEQELSKQFPNIPMEALKQLVYECRRGYKIDYPFLLERIKQFGTK